MVLAGFTPVWGNEIVEAVFQLGSTEIDVSQNANDVMRYLEDLERSLPLYQKICDLEQKVGVLQQEYTEVRALMERTQAAGSPPRALSLWEQLVKRLAWR
jgi:hypothetical protein